MSSTSPQWLLPAIEKIGSCHFCSWWVPQRFLDTGDPGARRWMLKQITLDETVLLKNHEGWFLAGNFIGWWTLKNGLMHFPYGWTWASKMGRFGKKYVDSNLNSCWLDGNGMAQIYLNGLNGWYWINGGRSSSAEQNNKPFWFFGLEQCHAQPGRDGQVADRAEPNQLQFNRDVLCFCSLLAPFTGLVVCYASEATLGLNGAILA